METTVFQVEVLDGRTYRVVCKNKNQKKRFIRSLNVLEHLYPKVDVVTNGLHDISQWDKVVETELNFKNKK